MGDEEERRTVHEGQRAGACTGTGVSDSPGFAADHDGKAGSPGTGGVAQDVLPMGGACPQAMALRWRYHVLGGPVFLRTKRRRTLRQRIRELEKKLDLAEKALEVKELLAAYEEFRDRGAKKKKNRGIGRSDRKD